jgi:preprotein translocase subunit SecG
MILAATDWLAISINLLLVVFVVVCLLMSLMILMQRPKQEGLGAAFGGGMTDQMFGARTTNVLQRGTVWCASLFFILALTLAVMIGMKNSRDVSMKAPAETAAAKTPEGAPAGAPEEMSEAIRSLLEAQPDVTINPEPVPEVPAPAPETTPAPEAPAPEAPAPEAPAPEAPAPEAPGGENPGTEENSGQP